MLHVGARHARVPGVATAGALAQGRAAAARRRRLRGRARRAAGPCRPVTPAPRRRRQLLFARGFLAACEQFPPKHVRRERPRHGRKAPAPRDSADADIGAPSPLLQARTLYTHARAKRDAVSAGGAASPIQAELAERPTPRAPACVACFGRPSARAGGLAAAVPAPTRRLAACSAAKKPMGCCAGRGCGAALRAGAASAGLRCLPARSPACAAGGTGACAGASAAFSRPGWTGAVQSCRAAGSFGLTFPRGRSLACTAAPEGAGACALPCEPGCVPLCLAAGCTGLAFFRGRCPACAAGRAGAGAAAIAAPGAPACGSALSACWTPDARGAGSCNALRFLPRCGPCCGSRTRSPSTASCP